MCASIVICNRMKTLSLMWLIYCIEIVVVNIVWS